MNIRKRLKTDGPIFLMTTYRMRGVAAISSRGKGAFALRKKLSYCTLRRFPANPHGKYYVS
jgi:hypothetical protein